MSDLTFLTRASCPAQAADHDRMTHEPGEGNAGALTPAALIRRDRKARFLELLQEEGHITQAATRLGVSPSTVYRWRVQDEAFNAEVAEWITEEMETVVATNMFRIATSTDPKMANATVKAGEFMLKSLNREVYGDQLKQESTVTINHQVQVVHEVRDRLRAAQTEKLQRLITIDEPKE